MLTQSNFNLRTLDNHQPHSSWGGWRGFLDSCEVRDEADGVIYYGKTNCNYILFPNGTIIENHAFHGENLMRKIKAEGWRKVLDTIEAARNELQQALAGLRSIV